MSEKMNLELFCFMRSSEKPGRRELVQIATRTINLNYRKCER